MNQRMRVMRIMKMMILRVTMVMRMLRINRMRMTISGVLIMAVRVVMLRMELDIDLSPFRTPMPSRLPAGLGLPAHKLPKFSKIPPDPSRCLSNVNLGS